MGITTRSTRWGYVRFGDQHLLDLATVDRQNKLRANASTTAHGLTPCYVNNSTTKKLTIQFENMSSILASKNNSIFIVSLLSFAIPLAGNYWNYSNMGNIRLSDMDAHNFAIYSIVDFFSWGAQIIFYFILGIYINETEAKSNDKLLLMYSLPILLCPPLHLIIYLALNNLLPWINTTTTLSQASAKKYAYTTLFDLVTLFAIYLIFNKKIHQYNSRQIK